MDLTSVFVIPVDDIDPVLDALNISVKENGQAYWHMHVTERSPGCYSLLLPKKATALNLDAYRVDLSSL